MRPLRNTQNQNVVAEALKKVKLAVYILGFDKMQILRYKMIDRMLKSILFFVHKKTRNAICIPCLGIAAEGIEPPTSRV